MWCPVLPDTRSSYPWTTSVAEQGVLVKRFLLRFLRTVVAKLDSYSDDVRPGQIGMQNALELLRTCYFPGNEGTRMSPRSATAHGCSFALVAAQKRIIYGKFLEVLISGALSYLPWADTSEEWSKLCKRQFHTIENTS